MISFNKSSGFITLTVVLIIILLVTALTLMTGRMLLNEQRTASNLVRYHEAANAAQFGLDKAIAQLILDSENRTNIAVTSTAPYYNVTFGTATTVNVGGNTMDVIPITSIGRSGYSAGATASTEAESHVTIEQQIVIVPALSAAPAAPITVAAGIAAGGNFSVAANPNGGGPGVPVSIWSENTVNIGSSSSTCGQQEYADGTCSSSPYSSNKTGKESDIVDNDTVNFPDNLLAYIFNGSQTIQDVIDYVKQAYPESEYSTRLGTGNGLADCSSLNTGSKEIYIVRGNCNPPGDVGSADTPVVLLVVNGDLTLNANKNIYGLVFAYAENPATATYDITLNGNATVYGALVANYELGNSNGTYNAVYDADVLSKLKNQVNSIIALVPGSWRDW